MIVALAFQTPAPVSAGMNVQAGVVPDAPLYVPAIVIVVVPEVPGEPVPVVIRTVPFSFVLPATRAQEGEVPPPVVMAQVGASEVIAPATQVVSGSVKTIPPLRLIAAVVPPTLVPPESTTLLLAFWTKIPLLVAEVQFAFASER